jgi:uncharacterized surface protein with fasciclin (FAS1) repeats
MKKIVTILVLTVLFVGLASPAMARTMEAQNNIVQTAKDAGSFNTLLSAAQSAGLADTLSSGGPYTVFAPTDDAFNKLPSGTVQSLMNDKPKLTNILKYHVVQGKYTVSDLEKMGSVKTIDGKTLMIKKQPDGSVMVDGAKIIKSNVPASNGMIQVIDSVMIPK